MMRRISSLCCFLLAVAAAVTTANADVILRTTQMDLGTAGSYLGPFDGPTSSPVLLNPGDEIKLLISLQYVPTGAPFLQYSGGDFLFDSGSDATLHGTEFLLSQVPGGYVGRWTDVPPEGGTNRFFTGGPDSWIFPFSGTELGLGTIVLRAGSQPGIFTTSFSEVQQLDTAFNDIPYTLQGFSYQVVPEPSSVMLLGLAGIGLVARRRRS